jgi:hypothetical protein
MKMTMNDEITHSTYMPLEKVPQFRSLKTRSISFLKSLKYYKLAASVVQTSMKIERFLTALYVIEPCLQHISKPAHAVTNHATV